jgi:CRISPR/Cas system CSM-associated protein Csm3 (group 7 of RAMP superfamily)
MGFDFMKEMQRPTNDIQHLQPWRLYHAKNVMTGGDPKAQGYYQFLKNSGRRILADGRQLLNAFGIYSPQCISASVLPEFSWVLNLNFTLASSYIAKDDAVFTATENPIRLEKVIGLPYVSPAAWKGLLRSEFQSLDKEITERLFGTDAVEAEESQSKGRQGRLCFFPTFFEKIALDIINPHNRETKTAASGPLIFEVVPKDSIGQLQIIYIPFGPNCDLNTSLSDLEKVAKGLKALLLDAGISAKRNVGYGLLNDQLCADKGSYFQINNNRYMDKPDLETETENHELPANLFQENGDIISYDEFCNLYPKKACETAFGNNDWKKAYNQLSGFVKQKSDKKDDKNCKIQKFPVQTISGFPEQIAKLREE